jgi:hypothetical protein
MGLLCGVVSPHPRSAVNAFWQVTPTLGVVLGSFPPMKRGLCSAKSCKAPERSRRHDGGPHTCASSCAGHAQLWASGTCLPAPGAAREQLAAEFIIHHNVDVMPLRDDRLVLLCNRHPQPGPN